MDAALSFLGQLQASKFILLDDVGLDLGDCDEFQRIWGMPGCTVLCTSRFPALTTPPLRVPTVGAPDSQTPPLQASSAGGDQPSPRPQLRRIWLPAEALKKSMVFCSGGFHLKTLFHVISAFKSTGIFG